jgi:S-adenosylmethionine decarboxylase
MLDLTIPPDLTQSLSDGFEGPEKRLEVYFNVNPNDPLGLCSITKDQWQVMLDNAKCTIISSTCNKFLNSYVLSESSLFVYPYKILVKTCGTTTLLFCLEKLIEYATLCNTKINYLIFSRKNYNFPEKQIYPHKNFDSEIQYLDGVFSHGNPLTLGPDSTCEDYQLVYFVKNEPKSVASDPSTEYKSISQSSNGMMDNPTVEVLMSQLDIEAMANFYKTESFTDSKAVTRNVGLADIFPDMLTDEIMFDPCGYSVNAISNANGSYFTVHVTPEPHCSFVSFETNHPNFVEDGLVEKVLKIFRPGRFSIVRSFFGEKLPVLPSQFEGFENLFESSKKFDGEFSYALNLFQSHRLNKFNAG